MFECDGCGKETKVVFTWGRPHGEHLCEDCYFSALGADPTDFPTQLDISQKQQPTLGVYDA